VLEFSMAPSPSSECKTREASNLLQDGCTESDRKKGEGNEGGEPKVLHSRPLHNRVQSATLARSNLRRMD